MKKLKLICGAALLGGVMFAGALATKGPIHPQDIPAPCGQDGFPACTSCSDCDSMPWWARWACYMQCV